VRHFRNIADLKLAGTDANLTPIEWNRKNLPGIEFSHNGLQPPLSYQDGSFDFIYALSVFTHIPLVWQRAWLDELHRVTTGAQLLPLDREPAREVSRSDPSRHDQLSNGVDRLRHIWHFRATPQNSPGNPPNARD
jgi:Methyltransferase domain